MQQKIVSWLKRQVKESSSGGVVFGVSGGIDSAVVAALCLKAFGKGNLLALWLPCHSQNNDFSDAQAVASSLGIELKVVDLSEVFDSLLKILPPTQTIAKNNIKPRLRMITLYYYANMLNYLVVGTGNKSELMAGYFTKYGDGGVDLLPLGDLLKKDVRTLAKELKIPQGVIAKAPTAGLWAGQTDEGEMGITYEALDKALEALSLKKKAGLNKPSTAKVKRMIIRSEHKRNMPKICKKK